MKRFLKKIKNEISYLNYRWYLHGITRSIAKDSVSGAQHYTARACVLPAAAPGSMGDDAMLLGLKELCAGLDIELYPIQFFADNQWDFLNEPVGLLPDSESDWVKFVTVLRRYNALFINGADVMDGGYGSRVVKKRIALAYIASSLGLSVVVTGFSYSGRAAAEELKKYFRLLDGKVTLCLRDPVSFERFSNSTRVQAQLVADLAFYLKPLTFADNLENEKSLKDIQARKAEGYKVLALNICAHSISEDVGAIKKDKIERLLDVYGDSVTRFLEENERFVVILVPHDYRSDISDLKLAAQLYERLSSRFTERRIYFLDQKCSAAEIKMAASFADIAFSGRMHFAIACLGMSVPVACCTYQGKFEGLYNHFNLDRKLLVDQSMISHDSVYATILFMYDNYKKIKLAIEAKLAGVKALSRTNVAAVETISRQ